MAKQNIEIAIGSKFSGEGFKKLNNALKTARPQLTKVGGGIANVVDAVGGLDGSLKKVSGPIKNFIGSFLSGGVWGLAIAGASALFGWIVKMTKPVDEVTARFRDQLKALKSLDAMASGYQKRVESWRKAAKDREDAEKKAKDAEKKLAEERKKANEDGWKYGREYAAIQAKINEESSKAGLLSKDELTVLRTKVKLMLDAAKANVADKQMGVNQAKANGNGNGIDIAVKQLELAKAQQKNITAEAKQMVDEYKKAKKSAEYAAQAQMDAILFEEKKRKEKEAWQKKLADAELKVEKNKEDIENRIAKAKEEAARLEENAARARGVSFGDWQRGERDRARGDRKAAGDKAKREKQVADELGRLEKLNPRTLTDWQKNRISKLKEWQADQDPNNNPALKEAEKLQKLRDEYAKRSADSLDKIRTAIENGGMNI